VDASVRRDKNSAIGQYYQAIGPGGTAGEAYDLSQPQLIDSSFGRTSYSMGANSAAQRGAAARRRASIGAAAA
jgi:hypothetical protein